MKIKEKEEEKKKEEVEMGKTKKKQTSLNFIPASAAALEGKNLCDPFEELVLFQSLLESTLFLLRDPRVNIEVASQTSRPVSRSNTTFYMAGGPSDGQACRHAAQERSGDSAVAKRSNPKHHSRRHAVLLSLTSGSKILLSHLP